MLLFRGRLRPNIQPNPDDPLEIFFTRPLRARDLITLQIKELDTYRDPQNRQISEGTSDDLLATFTGRITGGAPRRFQVESHRNESDDTSLPTIKIKFEGSSQVYDIPVISEEGESEGSNWEIAFIVQYPGQDDYTSPVAYIPKVRGRMIVLHNTMTDLPRVWEVYTNRMRKLFEDRGLQARMIRGSRSDTAIAHYSAANTTSYAGGYDYNVFTDETNNYEYIFFCCHGNVILDGSLYGQRCWACTICHHRFAHNQFGTCTRYDDCMRTRRGYYHYRLRTTNNAEIRLTGTAGQTPLRTALPDRLLRRIVDSFVDWDEYEQAFVNANPNTPGQPERVITNTAAPQTIGGVNIPGETTYDVVVPNNYQFPTLLAFPTSATRPDFRQYHLPQDPASAFLHHSSAQDVPGNPVICFWGPGGPLSDEKEATPNAGGGEPFPVMIVGSGTEFTSAPTGLEKVEGDGQIALSWQEVTGARSYTIYWSTSSGVTETGANTNAIIGVLDSFYVHEDTRVKIAGRSPSGTPVRLTNGINYYYKVKARRPTTYLSTENWSGMGDLSHVKVLQALCCLTGRKKVFANAVLDTGVTYFIAHQVIVATRGGRLVRRFWDRWLRRGAILRNLINIYNESVLSDGSFRATRPIVYYRDNSNQTKFWRPGMSPPPRTDIKVP